MGEVIVVVAPGNVGKTTLSANIGTGLAAVGHKVVLVDLNIGMRNLDVEMGLQNRIVYDVVDVTSGNCRLKQALIKDRCFPNLFLLPAAQTKDQTAINPDQIRYLAEELKKEFDYAIIDGPDGIDLGFRNAIAGANRAIVVITPEVSAVRDADHLIGLLEASELRNPKLIISSYRPDVVKRGDTMNINDILDFLAIELLGVVPEYEGIVINTNRGKPEVLENSSRVGEAYRRIIRRIQGQEVPFINFDTPIGLLNRLKRLVGKGNWQNNNDVTHLVSKDSEKTILDKEENLQKRVLDKQTKARSKLGQVIFKYGVTCADAFQVEIEENANGNGTEYALLWMTVMLESIFFFLDHTNRIVLKKLGEQGMKAMSTDLLYKVLDLVAGKYLKSTLKNRFKISKRKCSPI